MAPTILITPPPIGGSLAALPCPVVPSSRADLLDMLGRVLDADWVYGLKPDQGYELLEAFAKVGERLSLAVARLACTNYLLSASGPNPAVGTAFFSRPTDVAGAFVLRAGTVVRDSTTQATFQTTQDQAFGANDLGPFEVPIQSIGNGFEFNAQGQIVTAGGTIIPGDIDTAEYLLEEPQLQDLSLVVTQEDPTAGGYPPALDQLAADRGIIRRPGETDERLRYRAWALPSTVTRDAIEQQAQDVLDQVPAKIGQFIETFEVSFQTFWDCPSFLPAGSTVDPNLFVYDDPRPPWPPFNNRWLDEETQQGAFIVVVEPIPALRDFGGAYDDTAMTYQDVISPGVYDGKRALLAYDLPLDALAEILPGFWSGTDDKLSSVYSGLFALLQEIKAAGVAAIVELAGN